MRSLMASWQFWAILSAIFASLTAIFAKIGVSSIDSNLATLIRTFIVVVVLVAIVAATGHFSDLAKVSGKTWLFLILSGLATGASWLCYFRALKLGDAGRVAPIDKLSVVLVALLAALFLGERYSATGWIGIALIGGGAVLVAISG